VVSIKIVEGRFGVVRFDDEFSVAEIAKMRSELLEAFSTAHAAKIVLFSDLRAVQGLKADVKAPLTKILVTDNPRVERNAVVVTRGRPMVMQAHNILEEASGKGNRKLFTEASEAVAWLAEVLSAKERQALQREVGI
jgi:hypothetical protein